MANTYKYRKFLEPLRAENPALSDYNFHEQNYQYVFKREGDVELSFGVRLDRVSVRLVLHGEQKNEIDQHFDELQKKIGGVSPDVRWELKKATQRASVILFREGDFDSNADELRNWMFNAWKVFEDHRSNL